MYWERIRKTRENKKKKDKKTKRFTTKKRNYDYCGKPDNVFQIQESCLQSSRKSLECIYMQGKEILMKS